MKRILQQIGILTVLIVTSGNIFATNADDDFAYTDINTALIINVGLNDDISANVCDVWSSNGLLTTESNGILNQVGNWEFNYTPAVNFTGVDSFYYEYCDGFGNIYDTVLVQIAVGDPSLCGNFQLNVINYTHASTSWPDNGSFTCETSGGTPGYIYKIEPTYNNYSGAIGFPSQDSIVFTGLAGADWKILVFDNNGCASEIIFSLPSDSVFPGDTDYDRKSGVYDIFNIGIGYGVTGGVRFNASTNWIGQYKGDWWNSVGASLRFVSGVNYKHADCNGDGIINVLDVGAILLNYGLTHGKGIIEQPFINGIPSLVLEANPDTVDTNSLVTIKVKLGDLVDQIDSIYGIAFTLNYDPSLVDSASINVKYNNSWLGNISNNNDLIAIEKSLYQNGKLAVGITRTNQMNISGFGEIAEIEIFTTDDIAGKATIFENLNFTLSDVKIITYSEAELQVNLIGDSVTISSETAPSGSQEYLQSTFEVFPNPATEFLNIRGAGESNFNWTLLDVNGKVVALNSKSNQSVISLEDMKSGMYFLKISSDHQVSHYKIVKK